MSSISADAPTTDSLPTEMQVLRDELQKLRAELDAHRNSVAGSPPATSHPASSPAPPVAETRAKTAEDRERESDDEVFARLRAMSLLKEDNATSRPNASRPEPDRAPAAPAAPAARTHEPPRSEPRSQHGSTTHKPAAAGHHDEEESIDTYMSRLLERLNGGRSGDKPTPDSPQGMAARTAPAAGPPAASPPTTAAPSERTAPAPVRPTAPVVAEVEEEEPTIEAAPLVVEDETPWDAAVMMPPRGDRERHVNLSAMRELANQNAHSAIGASLRKRWSATGLSRGGMAAGAAVVGVTALYFSRVTTMESLKMPLTGLWGIAFVATAFWTAQCAHLISKIWRLSFTDRKATVAAAAKAESQAAEAADAAKDV